MGPPPKFHGEWDNLGTPVQVIQGGTYDQQHRPLHYIYVMGAAGRIEFAYRYGTVPDGS